MQRVSVIKCNDMTSGNDEHISERGKDQHESKEDYNNN